jgi:urease accessory protein
VTRTALDLIFADVGGRTAMTRRRYRWPLSVGRVFEDPVRPAGGTVTVQNAAGTLIPGDVLRQRISVVDGGTIVVRGQGATVVSGAPGRGAAVEDTCLQVGVDSRLWLDASPRILTRYARFRQHIEVCVEGSALLVDAVVLHPEVTDATFGGYESTVRITAPDGQLQALDAQALDALPRVRRAPRAFATAYAVGAGFDVPAIIDELEALTVLTGDRRVYVAVSALPGEAGWTVRAAAWDGGTLRSTIGAVCARLDSTARSGRGCPTLPRWTKHASAAPTQPTPQASNGSSPPRSVTTSPASGTRLRR